MHEWKLKRTNVFPTKCGKIAASPLFRQCDNNYDWSKFETEVLGKIFMIVLSDFGSIAVRCRSCFLANRRLTNDYWLEASRWIKNTHVRSTEIIDLSQFHTVVREKKFNRECDNMIGRRLKPNCCMLFIRKTRLECGKCASALISYVFANGKLDLIFISHYYEGRYKWYWTECNVSRTCCVGRFSFSVFCEPWLFTYTIPMYLGILLSL